MKRLIPFKNPKTGEIKKIELGFSWTLFAFSFCGIPLFVRKLNVWGAVFIFLWFLNFLIPNLIVALVSVGLQIWVAFKGNELTAKNYLEHGWEFAEPDSELTKMAKQRWGIYLNNVPTDFISAGSANITTGTANTKYCFKCGQKNHESALFCSNCGVSQAMPSETAI